MRFSSASLLLGIAAIGSFPAGLGRALPNSIAKSYNENYVRAAPVHIEPEPVVAPGPKPAPGGTSSGGSDGGDAPVHIGAPDDKTPGSKPDDTPVHIGAPDKTPGDSGQEPPPRVGAGNSDDVDLWCRGSGCAGNADKTAKLMTPDELSKRGVLGTKLVDNAVQGKEYSKQLADNYEVTKEEFHGVKESLEQYDYEQKYGFQEVEGWQSMEVVSKGNPETPVVEMSVGRASKGDDDYVALVAHWRYAEQDSNRFKFENGAPVKDDKGNQVPNPDKDPKAVPAAQLVYVAAKESGKLTDKKPKKYFFISDLVANQEAKEVVPAAHEKMNKVGQPLVLRKGAPGEEGNQFNIIAGIDNNYSFLNTIGRNPDIFGGYEITSIETRDKFPITMSIELSLKE